jgi:predicted secreted protein
MSRVVTARGDGLTRRSFLKATALAGGAVSFGLASPEVLGNPGRVGANQRLVIAHIGVGGMGIRTWPT